MTQPCLLKLSKIDINKIVFFLKKAILNKRQKLVFEKI